MYESQEEYQFDITISCSFLYFFKISKFKGGSTQGRGPVQGPPKCTPVDTPNSHTNYKHPRFPNPSSAVQ